MCSHLIDPDSAPETVRADWLFTGTELIQAATMRMCAGKIVDVTVTDQRPDVDLPGCAILPWLVNAHTHLEFSDLPAPLGPSSDFIRWIESVIRYRQQRGDEPSQLTATLQRGIKESMDAGVGFIGEIATSDSWMSTGTRELESLQGIRFLELIGNGPERVRAALSRAASFLSGNNGNLRRGLSPHAPYSTSVDLVEGAVRLAHAAAAPVAMHLAETKAEIEWMAAGTGPFADFLRARGLAQPGHRAMRAMDYLDLLSQAPRSLIVHGNYLDQAERSRLAELSDRMSLVFCPRTHAYFAHPPYPLQELLEAGVRVALGTDSRASNPDLNLWSELCWVSRENPDVGTVELLRMSTVAGLEALGWQGQVGHLAVGQPANFFVIAMPPSSDLRQSLFAGKVRQRWRMGRSATVE